MLLLLLVCRANWQLQQLHVWQLAPPQRCWLSPALTSTCHMAVICYCQVTPLACVGRAHGMNRPPACVSYSSSDVLLGSTRPPSACHIGRNSAEQYPMHPCGSFVSCVQHNIGTPAAQTATVLPSSCRATYGWSQLQLLMLVLGKCQLLSN